MKYYTYKELNSMLNISDKYKTKFREQSQLERSNLKEGLLYHKRVLEPLKLGLTMSGYTLIDGHHRWELLSSVIEECPEFDTNIPVVIVGSDDVNKVMLFTQLGRRNLSNEEIAQYAELLINQDGLTRKKAYQQVAEQIGCSESKVRRIVQPELAEAERARQQENRLNERMGDTADICSNLDQKTPESIETSLEEKPQSAIASNLSTSTFRKGIKGPVESSHSFNVRQPKKSKLLTQESVQLEDRSAEELAHIYSGKPLELKQSNELDRLLFLQDIVDELKANLSKYQDYSIYDSMFSFISHFENRLKELK